MDNIKDFLVKYRGALVGAVVAIVLLILKIYQFLIGCLVIVAGALIGNYIQQNKEKVKETIRRMVDKW